MYEYLYDAEIGEFGCIRHDTISFLGAYQMVLISTQKIKDMDDYLK